jgi:predicted unusual protein kinase regulating ubiquinone biosynthesis (AarF/ABC1/UbiB family)
MAHRDSTVPVGRLGRLARLARLGTQVGANLILSRDAAATAASAAEALGRLRGLATKVGQMASYVDGLIPEAHEEVFEVALRQLRAGTPHSAPWRIRELVETELGGSIERLFAEWSDEPFASASIGQVHRAVLHDGRRVAVKVQHPGIDQAMENDLSNGALVARLVGTLAPGALEAERLYSEVARHFRDELDYRREATWQEQFRTLHASDPAAIIPAVVRERSARRVLCMELMGGEDLEAAALRPEADRRRYAEILWRFVYKSILVGGLFNADPHPGNYLFRKDGKVVFLDFGCVQELTQEVQSGSREAHRAAASGDEAGFARHAAGIVGAQGGQYERAFTAYLRRAVEPVFDSPFRITRGYARELVTGLYDLKKSAFAKDSQFMPLPESTVLLNRLQLGFFSVLARLDVEVDYRAVEAEFV